MKTVLFAPEVEEDLFELTKILVDKQYLANADYAVSYISSLVFYIREQFVERANAYLVTHITNNHVNGQYFNQ